MNRPLKILFLCFSIVLLLIGCGKKGEEPVEVAEKAAEPTITVDNAISADGVSIAYEVRGEGEPTLVFVHGWSNNRVVWQAELAHFSQKYKVVAIDLAGFGASGNDRENWTMEAFGEDVVAVMNKVGLDNTVLIGFSMGAPVILEAAKSVPESVIGLVIVDYLHNIEHKYSEEEIANTAKFMMDWVKEPTYENTQGLIVRNKAELTERLISTIKGVPTVGWSESYKNMLRWCNDKCAEALQTIKAPVTSINSDQQPTNVEAFRKYVPTFKAKIIKGIGHGVFWEAPEEFSSLLEKTIQEFVQMKELE